MWENSGYWEIQEICIRAKKKFLGHLMQRHTELSSQRRSLLNLRKLKVLFSGSLL